MITFMEKEYLSFKMVITLKDIGQILFQTGTGLILIIIQNGNMKDNG